MLDLSHAIDEMDAYSPFEAIDRRITAEAIVQGVRLTADQFVEETIRLGTALIRKDRGRVVIDDEALPLAA